MFDRPGVRTGIRLAGLVSVCLAAWYGWTRVDWYDYFPATPPDSHGETIDHPHTELLSHTIDGVDTLERGATVTAGQFFAVASRLRLDPAFWVFPLPPGVTMLMSPGELARLREKESTKRRCVVEVEIFRKSWLANGEKRVHHFTGTTTQDGKETFRTEANVVLTRPGDYLVRVRVGEQKPQKESAMRLPPVMNQRIVRTFLLHVDMPAPEEEKPSSS